MPRSSRTSARHRRRSIAAAISGLAIGVVGVSAAALPAVADPTGGGGAPPAASGPSPAAAAGGTHTVTLITGDRVRVTDLPDGTHTVDVETAVPGTAVQTVEVDGDLHVLPQSAMPYLAAGVVDRDLFNVTQLVEYGYDDASVSATPVILEFADGPATFGAPLPGVELGAPLESVGGAAATADHATAASTWNALTAASGASTFSTEVSLGGGIEAIHLDGKVQATLDSSVPWIGAPAAWEAGYTGTGVTVAVLDTGYDDTHPDLAGRVLAEDSRSFVPGEDDLASDLHGHGTHVASTIAGTGAASGGANRGVADGADLLVGKVLGADGSGQDSWIIEAMQWAGEHADIVSMSLGSSEPSDGTDVMSEALNTIAEQTGALFVVAAGNNGAPEAIGAPGAAAKALTVGSVADPTGALSYFSNTGPLAFSGALKPELVGPGEDVIAARSADSPGEGSYVGMSGTSMATPHVAGAAALLKQQHPEYTADQLRAALTSTARDVGLRSYEGGSGVVDLESAIAADVIASGSGDFGMLAWGEEPELVVRTIDYTNRGADEVVVDLAASLDGAPDGVLTMDADELTIPAGETALGRADRRSREGRDRHAAVGRAHRQHRRHRGRAHRARHHRRAGALRPHRHRDRLRRRARRDLRRALRAASRATPRRGIRLAASPQSSRCSSTRPIHAARVAASVMPSNPKPAASEPGVATTAASGNPAADVMMKLFGFGALPGGGPVTVQPPVSPASNDVVPWPVDTSMSSTNTPRPWVDQSLTYPMDTSTWPPA